MKIRWLIPIIFINVIAHVATVDDSLKLIFVQILFRHGDRAPIKLYPNDPNLETSWPEGLAHLTKLGRQQHYGLGKFFRSYYKNFVTSSPLEVNVISSEVDRCLKSAETNLASFFAPDDVWKFEKDVNWQPISIHYVPKNKDRFLETESDCPTAEAEEQRIVDSPEGQMIIAKHKEMFDNLTYYSGSPITNWTAASYLHDVLYVEKKYNLTVPKWVDPYWKELEEVSALSFYWSYNSPLLLRLRAGPLLKRMITRMKQKGNGDIPKLKLQIYSAHDTNIAVVLHALNLFNMKQPPYCASLLFELYEGPNDSNYIRLLYLNSTEPEKISQIPHVLIIEGCKEFCPLEYFINYTQNLIPQDWDEECQISKSFVEILTNQEVTIGVLCIVVVSVMIVMSFIAVWRAYKARRDRYAYHLMSMDS